MSNEIEEERTIFSAEEAEAASKTDEYTKKLSYFFFGSLGIFIVILLGGFIYQSRLNARLNGEFQARRVETLWKTNVPKRKLIIERSKGTVTEEILQSPLIRSPYLQKAIIMGIFPGQMGSVHYGPRPILEDFHKLTLMVLQNEWAKAFALGKQFIAKYHLPDSFDQKEKGKEKRSLEALSIEELLLPLQYLRQVALARHLEDHSEERAAIEELLVACGQNIEDLRNHSENVSTSSMFDYCFRTMKEGSIGIEEYIVARWEALQPQND